MSIFKANMSKLSPLGFRTGDNPYYSKMEKAFVRDPHTGLFPSSSVTKVTFQPGFEKHKEIGTVIQLNLRQYSGSDEETQKHRSIRDVFQKQFGEGVVLTCFSHKNSFVRAIVITTKRTDLVKLWEQIWTLIQDFDDHKFSTYKKGQEEQEEEQEEIEGSSDSIEFNWAESFADAPALPSNTNEKKLVVEESSPASVPAEVKMPAPAPIPVQDPIPVQNPASAPAPPVSVKVPVQVVVQDEFQDQDQDQVQEYQQYFSNLLDLQIHTLTCMDMEISAIRQHLEMKIKERAVIAESARKFKGIYNLE